MRKTSILIAAVVASIVLISGPVAAQGLGSVSVDAGPQATTGDNVTVDSVEIDQDGWVAVYEEARGGPDLNALVGSAEVSQGTSTNIEVDTDIQEDGFYYAVLHHDESPMGELNPQTDPIVEVNGTQVQDFFFVAVGTRDVHQQYAVANQNRRELRNRLDDLREQVDDLERRSQRSGNASVQSDIERLRSEIDTTEQRIQELESTISETERLLRQLEEAERRAEEARQNNQTDGNETADNETDDETDGNDGGSEGLPGFTALAALVAVLTAALLVRRNG